MFIMPYLIIIAVAIWFFVFKPAADEESYNKGYDDGHVVGWNKICAPKKNFCSGFGLNYAVLK